MWIAYLLPPIPDTHLLLEDGLQWVAKGETAEEAEDNLRKLFDEQTQDEGYSLEESEQIWCNHRLFVSTGKGLA